MGIGKNVILKLKEHKSKKKPHIVFKKSLSSPMSFKAQTYILQEQCKM